MKRKIHIKKNNKIYKRNHKSNIRNDLININNKQKTIIRNPSKIFNPEDIKKELESYNSAAKKILLCGDEIFEIIYNKLSIDFTQIDKYLHSKNLYYNIKIKKIDILKKFFLQLKYIDIIYIPGSLLNSKYNGKNICNNLNNFLGFNLKKINNNYNPNNINECILFWMDITKIISEYLNNFETCNAKLLYIYINNDYMSFINKTKKICELFNYDCFIIDEFEQTKFSKVDKLSEAMKNKRLPNISEDIIKHLLLLEHISIKYNYKYYILKNINIDGYHKNKNILANISNINTNNKKWMAKSVDKINGKKNSDKNEFEIIKNNIYYHFTLSRTIIIINDSFSNNNNDAKYFNKILSKILITKIPIIILTNNLSPINKIGPKKLKNFYVNCIFNNNITKKDILIYYYIIILYINIRLCFLKFTFEISDYNSLINYINRINNNVLLSSDIIKKIIKLSEYFCYYGKFEIDIIDFKINQIFNIIEKEINNDNLNPNNYIDIVNFIYNNIFTDNFKEENNIEELANIMDIHSFFDCEDKIKKNLSEKIYENKLKYTDTNKYYKNNFDLYINNENLCLEKYFNFKDYFNNNYTQYNNKDIMALNDVNNTIINALNLQKKLLLSFNKKMFISNNLLPYYNASIKLINGNTNNNHTEEINTYINSCSFKKVFKKINNKYILNNIYLNYYNSFIIKKKLKKKKI